MITREIVASYGGVREMLERRRNVELVQAALQRLIDRESRRGSCRGSGPTIAKVPGKDEYVIAPRGTNNPQGAALQHAEGYAEAAIKHLEGNDALIQHVDDLVAQIRDARDRAILIDFYCNGMWDKEIAKEIGCDRSTVSRRRDGAIEDLEMRFHTMQLLSRE